MLKHRLVSGGSLSRSCAPEMGSTDTLTSTGSDSFTSTGSDTSGTSTGSLSGTSTGRKRRSKQRGVLKVYLGSVRADMEYKCLPVTCDTTSREVVSQTLSRCKMWGRDPNLYYLVMEINLPAHSSASSGSDATCRHVKEFLTLADDARPLELQHCQPNSRFYLHMRRGGLVKVHVSCLSPGTQYKSLLVSPKTTCLEMTRLLMKSCKVSPDLRPEQFAIHESCGHGRDILYERRLSFDDCPLLIQQSWTNSEDFSFHLRAVTSRTRPQPVRRRPAHSMDVGDFLLCQQMESVLDLCTADNSTPTTTTSPNINNNNNNNKNYRDPCSTTYPVPEAVLCHHRNSCVYV